MEEEHCFGQPVHPEQRKADKVEAAKAEAESEAEATVINVFP